MDNFSANRVFQGAVSYCSVHTVLLYNMTKTGYTVKPIWSTKDKVTNETHISPYTSYAYEEIKTKKNATYMHKSEFTGQRS